MSLRSRGVSALLPILLVLIAVWSTTAANRTDSGSDSASSPPQHLGEEPTAPTGEVAPTLGHLSEAQAAKLAPMLREINEILVQEQAQTRDLMAQLQSTRDPLAALEVQRKISDRKFRTQIELLEVQGRYAREEGRILQAEEAERVVARWNAQLEARQSDRREQ